MADADGEDQERREDIHRIDSVAQQAQDAELPDNGYGRADQRQDRQPYRSGIDRKQKRGDQERDAEVGNDPSSTIGDITDDLGKADDVHRMLFVFELGPNLFELGGDLLVIDFFAGFRVGFEKVGPDHRTREIFSHQPSDLAGLDNVGTDPFHHLRRRRKIGRYHIPSGKAILYDFNETNVGREYRPYAGTVDARQQKDTVADLLECAKEFRREHVAVAVHERDQYSVGSAELLIELERLHVLVIQRKLLLESRVDPQLGHVEGHQRGANQEDQQNQWADRKYRVCNSGLQPAPVTHNELHSLQPGSCCRLRLSLRHNRCPVDQPRYRRRHQAPRRCA